MSYAYRRWLATAAMYVYLTMHFLRHVCSVYAHSVLSAPHLQYFVAPAFSSPVFANTSICCRVLRFPSLTSPAFPVSVIMVCIMLWFLLFVLFMHFEQLHMNMHKSR